MSLSSTGDMWRPPWPVTKLSRNIRLPSGHTVRVHGELVSLIFTGIELNANQNECIFDTLHFPIVSVDDAWLMLLFCMYDSMNLNSLASFKSPSGDADIPVELYVDCLMIAAQCAPSLVSSERSPLIQRVNACFAQKNASCVGMIRRLVERFDPYLDSRAGRLLSSITARLDAPYQGIWSFAAAEAPPCVSVHALFAGVFIWLASLPSQCITGEYIDAELGWMKRYYDAHNMGYCWEALWNVLPLSAVQTSHHAAEWSNMCGISQRLWFPHHQTHLVLARNLRLVMWLPEESHLYIREGKIEVTGGFQLRQTLEFKQDVPWNRFIFPQLCMDLFDPKTPIECILHV